jgi:hypothetical protein
VAVFRRRKRRRDGAEWWQAVVDQHPTGTSSMAWDNADPHVEAASEAMVRAAAGRLILLYWPTYSPWLNLLELVWRQCRREVTHGELVGA